MGKNSVGSYWSAAKDGDQHAKDLYIGETFVTRDDKTYRRDAVCVRCVQDKP